MFKTRKNNLTMEDGHKLRNMIAGLSGPQQMTVIEILRENKDHCPPRLGLDVLCFHEEF